MVMRLYSDPTPIIDDVGNALARSMEDLRAEVESKEPRRSGALANSYGVLRPQVGPDNNWHTWLNSVAAYARAVERGAWVGAGHNRPAGTRRGARGRTVTVAAHARGPHMKGNFVIRNAFRRVFPTAMALRLGQAPRLRTSTRRAAKLPATPK